MNGATMQSVGGFATCRIPPICLGLFYLHGLYCCTLNLSVMVGLHDTTRLTFFFLNSFKIEPQHSYPYLSFGLSDLFTLVELDAGLASIKNGKAAGKDGIPPAFLQNNGFWLSFQL